MTEKSTEVPSGMDQEGSTARTGSPASRVRAQPSSRVEIRRTRAPRFHDPSRCELNARWEKRKIPPCKGEVVKVGVTSLCERHRKILDGIVRDAQGQAVQVRIGNDFYLRRSA